MTLTTLLMAWLPVAVLFLVFANYRGPWTRAVVLVSLAEAGVLTLLAGLWFGSLGHGGWLLVFLLLGAIAGAERGLRSAFLRSSMGHELRGFLLGLVRYGLAGALLAWRLG